MVLIADEAILRRYTDAGQVANAACGVRAPRLLRRVVEAAGDLYLSGPDGPRGCLTVVTAASEAVADPRIRQLVIEAIGATDQTFTALFSSAVERGALPASANPAALAGIATATIHTLAIRARVGAPRSALQGLVDAAVSTICGPETEPARRSGPAR